MGHDGPSDQTSAPAEDGVAFARLDLVSGDPECRLKSDKPKQQREQQEHSFTVAISVEGAIYVESSLEERISSESLGKSAYSIGISL